MEPNDVETYKRGDLSGIVISMDGELVRVRFIDASDHPGVTMSCRMVVRADGSLAIDPTGLPIRRPSGDVVDIVGRHIAGLGPRPLPPGVEIGEEVD